jgi:hypothetical protein
MCSCDVSSRLRLCRACCLWGVCGAAMCRYAAPNAAMCRYAAPNAPQHCHAACAHATCTPADIAAPDVPGCTTRACLQPLSTRSPRPCRPAHRPAGHGALGPPRGCWPGCHCRAGPEAAGHRAGGPGSVSPGVPRSVGREGEAQAGEAWRQGGWLGVLCSRGCGSAAAAGVGGDGGAPVRAPMADWVLHIYATSLHMGHTVGSWEAPEPLLCKRGMAGNVTQHHVAVDVP